jgi:predicted O-methyltransferase YrrM
MKTERLIVTDTRIKSEEFLKDSSESLRLNHDNPFLFTRSGLIAKLFFYKELYEIIESVPGSIVEVGCWFGQSSILFENIRAIIEPFNYSRKIISFDTFEGYKETTGLNIENEEILKYQVGDDWVNYLEKIQNAHKVINNSASKFINIKGDIRETITKYFDENYEPLSLVYYDIATYDTLKFTFNILMPFISKGGVFVFDDYGYQYEGVNQFLIDHGITKKYQLIHSKYYKSKVFLIVS